MSDSVTLWTIAHQAPPSMGFSKQEYWSGLTCTPPQIFPTPGNEPESSLSPALQADSLPTEPPGKPKNDTVASLNTDISANNFVFIFINEYISKQRRQWHPTPVLLPRKSHGQRSLVGCSTWGRPKSQTQLSNFSHFSLSRIGEGNGNPLQCSCLENPRDGGAWWAAVYGVTQSQTRLK